MDPKVKQLAECRLQKSKKNLEVVESLIRDGNNRNIIFFNIWCFREKLT